MLQMQFAPQWISVHHTLAKIHPSKNGILQLYLSRPIKASKWVGVDTMLTDFMLYCALLERVL